MSQDVRVEFDIKVERLGEGENAPRVVVAIPVKDEAERIGLCLEALALQADVAFEDIAVVLLLNNCTDGTADQVREMAPLLPFRLELHAVNLPSSHANAGWARKLAMDAAERLVASDGLILTTDADTLADEDWIAANRRGSRSCSTSEVTVRSVSSALCTNGTRNPPPPRIVSLMPSTLTVRPIGARDRPDSGRCG